MSKIKNAVDEFRKKLTDKQLEVVVEKPVVPVEATSDLIAYDVIQDPTTNSRKFVIVKLVYNLDTKEARIDSVRPFEDKTAGMAIQLDKKNHEYFYEKNNRGVNKK